MTRAQGSAVFSDCRLYRYRLTRSWLSAPHSPVLFVCLNPSTADALTDDATVRRMIGFAMRWGHSDLLLGNLFAYRSTQPRGMRTMTDPVGAANDEHITAMAAQADRIVVAWGSDWMVNRWTAPSGQLRARHMVDLLSKHGTVECLGLTRDGHPLHPLRLARDTPLIPLPTQYATAA